MCIRIATHTCKRSNDIKHLLTRKFLSNDVWTYSVISHTHCEHAVNMKQSNCIECNVRKVEIISLSKFY
jgi:hypothetical protein